MRVWSAFLLFACLCMEVRQDASCELCIAMHEVLETVVSSSLPPPPYRVRTTHFRPVLVLVMPGEGDVQAIGRRCAPFWPRQLRDSRIGQTRRVRHRAASLQDLGCRKKVAFECLSPLCPLARCEPKFPPEHAWAVTRHELDPALRDSVPLQGSLEICDTVADCSANFDMWHDSFALPLR